MTDEPTISPEYAAELVRQVDELEADDAALRDEIRHLRIENARLRDQAAISLIRQRALERAALDFIHKVDRGEAKSVKSYAAFKAALNTPRRTNDE